MRYFEDQVSVLPIDGRIFFLLDLPVSAAMDTALLPMAIFMNPKRPPYGFQAGCRWVTKR